MLLKFNRTAAALLGTMLAAQAHAGTIDLITNGSFERATVNGGQLGVTTIVTGWTSTGYNFLFPAGAADTTGVVGQYGSLSIWGPGNGAANGLSASSPDGGNFVAADGAYGVAPIEQTIHNLVVGDAYTLSFLWAGAQQSGYSGATTEQWQVSLGSETHSTAVVDNANHGFTGWVSEAMTFTATATTETVSFLAVGTPAGQPPFSLLDGVSMQGEVSVPEPGSMALLGTAIAALARWRRTRRTA